MVAKVTFGVGEKELAPGVVQLRDGMELIRADPEDEVWQSYRVAGCYGILTLHVNPKPEEIKPDWKKIAKP